MLWTCNRYTADVALAHGYHPGVEKAAGDMQCRQVSHKLAFRSCLRSSGAAIRQWMARRMSRRSKGLEGDADLHD